LVLPAALVLVPLPLPLAVPFPLPLPVPEPEPDPGFEPGPGPEVGDELGPELEVEPDPPDPPEDPESVVVLPEVAAVVGSELAPEPVVLAISVATLTPALAHEAAKACRAFDA